jgi:predicted nicotinamide N-methyase
MGFTARLKERIRHFAQAVLQPGERLQIAALVTVGPATWLDLLLFPLSRTFLHRPYYAILTDQRFILARPSVFSGAATIEFAEPRGAVRIVHLKEGWRPSLRLRRPNGAELALGFGRAWREELRAIADSLARR